MTIRLRLLVGLCALVGAATTADATPMFTKLSTVRIKATTVVVGVYNSTKKSGLVVDVEYNLRGSASKGPMTVGESPDGHVFIPLSTTKAQRRIVAFIDSRNRLRWVGKLIAGPSLEKGVLRIEGFFDFNAHIVGPGVMTLSQLRHYLIHGTLTQRFRTTLVFPDGKGGFSRTKRRIVVDYDPLARKATVHNMRWPCLRHYNMSPLSWGRFRLHLYCRKSRRRLTLSGPITGKHPNGEILVDVSPTGPIMYRKEFDRYVRDVKLTGLRRVFRVSIANGTSWKWILGRGIVDRRGRLRKLTSQSTSGSATRGRRFRRDTYRFGRGLTISIFGPRLLPYSNDFSLVQRIDARTPCVVRHVGKVHACHIRRAPPIWR